MCDSIPQSTDLPIYLHGQIPQSPNLPISQSPNPPITNCTLKRFRPHHILKFVSPFWLPCPNLRAASAQRYSRAKSAPRVASARLDNRKIAFGGGRLAVRGFSHRSVPLWGRCSPRLHEARWRGTSRRHSATAFAPGVVLRIHPHRRAHGPGRNTALGPCVSPARRLRSPAVRKSSGPVVGSPFPARAKGAFRTAQAVTLAPTHG